MEYRHKHPQDSVASAMSALLDAEREAKRLKLFHNFRPFPKEGAFSASRSSAILDEYVPKLTVHQVENDGFLFPPDAKDSRGTDVVIGQRIRRALRRKGSSEEALRNAVYTDLKSRHSVEFPTSCCEPWSIEMQLRSMFNADLRYRETDLASLLDEFYNNHVIKESTDEDVLVKETILHGLNLTTTSLPDMTVIREQSICLGEFKNSRRYSVKHATRQCALYLYALLYFFRVRLGRPVKAVFGFVVVGRDCSGLDQYTVGFIRLSAPDKLGKAPVVETYYRTCKTKDVTGIESLVDFLKRGKFVELSTGANTVDRPRRIPALLTLPEDLWESEFLVTNGSASMVFKGNAKAILFLLGQFDPGSEHYYDFNMFVESVEKFFEELPDSTRTFYLKIALKDTTLRESPARTIEVIGGKAKHLLDEAYCVRPLGRTEFGVFLMNDCGTVLHESEDFAELTYTEFVVLYRVFWTNTISMTQFCLHGDALPHNIVYKKEDPRKLMLIDLDEGVSGIDAPNREIARDSERKYRFLCYPNFCRAWHLRTVYTQLQLVASFLLIMPFFQGTEESVGEIDGTEENVGEIEGIGENVGEIQGTGENVDEISLLHEQAEAVDSFLRDCNMMDPSTAATSDIQKRMEQMIDLMENILELQVET